MRWGWQQFVVAGVLFFYIGLFFSIKSKVGTVHTGRLICLGLFGLELIALISAGFFK